MNFSFQSWEFLFVWNIGSALFFPWIYRNQRYRLYILLGLLILPLLAGAVEHLIVGRGDFCFYFKLWILHWSASLTSLIVVLRNGGVLCTTKFYLFLLLSLVLSIFSLVFSRSLWFLDPFWGVVPGTISIDAIISLDPFLIRFLGLLIFWGILLASRKTLIALASYWAFFFILGFAQPGTLTQASAIESSFQIQHREKFVEIYIENEFTSSFSPKEWAKEINFILSQTLQELPPNIQWKTRSPFKIFIYATDDSKARWIGARQTQIGHFLHNELHLSEVVLSSPILAHEIVHLIHGQIWAPIKSYLNPLFLEGLAVAASEEKSFIYDKAAALLKKWPKHLELTWPFYLDFFEKYSPTVSYSLAGAYVRYFLDQKLWPWSEPEPSMDFLSERTPSAETLRWAEKVFEHKPLFRDPFRRDCTRLEWQNFKNHSDALTAKLDKICPLWKERPSYRRPLSEDENIENSLDYLTIDSLKQAELTFYKLLKTNSPLSPRDTAEKFLEYWKWGDLPEAKKFKSRLEWEVKTGD